jgi:hypothetical protein
LFTRRLHHGHPRYSRQLGFGTFPGRSGKEQKDDRFSLFRCGPVLSLLPGDAVTGHSIDTAGGRLTYTATAGTFSLFDQSGERSTAVFCTAYVAQQHLE